MKSKLRFFCGIALISFGLLLSCGEDSAAPQTECTSAAEVRCEGTVLRTFDSCGKMENAQVCDHGCNEAGNACADEQPCLEDECIEPCVGDDCGEPCEGDECPAPCVPQSCDDLGAECGALDDGCGTLLLCGDCASPETCGAVEANQCDCVPTTCEESGAACGSIADGCGGTLECGECEFGECEANQCVCVPLTCEDLNATCGEPDDGCGGTLNCGGCPEFSSCGSEVPWQCGVCVQTKTCFGLECGPIDNGCNYPENCGSCGAPLTCGGGGIPNKCG